jgi:D-cysteine desulfhydrase
MDKIHAKEPPRLNLAQIPTPVMELNNLARQFGIPRLLIKRDDLTGFELSGNKIRKLEYIVTDALASGADTLVTHGGFQSNHCRATAAVGARLGLRVRMMLRSADPSPPSDGNLFLDRLLGAEVTIHHPDEYNGRRRELIDSAMESERRAGHRPYFFPVGASIPLGCWGYIRCVAELIEQLGRETPLHVFCAVSSAGTCTGLLIGRALLGCRNWQISGVPVSDSVRILSDDIRKLERETNERFGLGLSESDTPIDMIDGFIGEGYAIPYPEEVETIRLLARTEGLLLDPVYTGKAMTGMLAVIRNGGLRPGEIPVFIHTGGAFGLMARRDLFTPAVHTATPGN